jgi:UDP-N-acetylmuramoyl-tripeptide--D-alanyl-D-alanine ligase
MIEWTLSDLLGVSGAKPLYWPHQGGPLQAVERVDDVNTKAVYFPMWYSTVNESLFAQLAAAGAKGIALFPGQSPPCPERFPTLGVIRLDSPALGYLRLAAQARRDSRSLFVGITGSSGKSSTKEYLAQILAGSHKVHATKGSHNLVNDAARIILQMNGTPDEAAVLELGFGQEGDIDRMAALVKPYAGIITNVTLEHLDGAKGRWEIVAQEKGRLARHLPNDGFLVINGDDAGAGLAAADSSFDPRRIFRFGMGPSADAAYTEVIADEYGTAFTYRIGEKERRCRLRAYGAVQAANAAAAALTAHLMRLSAEQIVSGLEAAEPLPRRFTVHRFTQRLTLIDDTFSGSVNAVLQGLAASSQLAGSRRKMILLSGIAGLADRSTELHKWIGQSVAANGFTRLLLVCPDDRTDAIKQGAVKHGLHPTAVTEVPNVHAMPEALLKLAGPEMVIYCKCSQYLWVGPSLDLFRCALPEHGFSPLVS